MWSWLTESFASRAQESYKATEKQREKIKELKQEMAGKEKELDALNEADPKSLWQADLVALDEQLRLDGNYPSAKSPPEIAEEAPRKKAPAKRAAASPLPQRANKKR
ncbi:DNA topoisomerase 2 [Tanacetum coccineum]